MTYNLVRGWAPLRGVLVERRKYIDQPIPELYDLAADPAETDNRAAAERDTLQVMGHVLRGYDVAPPARPGRESADVAATLRSLGYISGHAPARRTYTEADDLKTLVAVDRDLHEATRLYQQGRTGEAIAGFERVIQRRPDTADAYISLAHAFWESGRPRPAIATLERALTSGAPDRDVRIRLGIYLAESGGDTARAVQLLESLPDTDVEALNGLGVAYTNARRFDEAAAAFERVLALDPTNGLAYQNLASIALARAQAARAGRERQAGLDEAERLANLALQTDPALAKACTTLGVVLSETGRRAEAIDAWKRAVELDPAELDALYNLAIVLAGAGRLEEARGYARQFVATAPAALYGPAVEQVRKLLEDGEGSLPPPGRW
jgi:tetratricopeptide (TPR) repeat protein